MASCLSRSLDGSSYYDPTVLDLFTSDLYDALNHETTISPASDSCCDRQSSDSSLSGNDSTGIKIPGLESHSLPTSSNQNFELLPAISFSLPARTDSFISPYIHHSLNGGHSSSIPVLQNIPVLNLSADKDYSKITCRKHGDAELNLYCNDCKIPGCRECVLWCHVGHHFAPLPNIAKHSRNDVLQRVQLVHEKIQNLQRSMDLVYNTRKSFSTRITSIKSNINTLANQIISATETRRTELLLQLKKIEDIKTASWLQLNESYQTTFKKLIHTVDELINSLSYDEDKNLISNKEIDIIANESNFPPVEDEIVEFKMPDISLYHNVRNMGLIQTSACSKNTHIADEGVTKGRLYHVNTFTVRAADHLNQKIYRGGDHIRVDLVAPNNVTQPVQIQDQNDGSYLVTYRPMIEGTHLMSIMLRGIHINGSPFQVDVTNSRDYWSIRSSILTFGSEGDQDGQFCRPWGVCCDQEDRIIVADRSNNRVQVFNVNGHFLFKFGKEGSNFGEFKRPAGVAVDKFGKIIVADKDNHRIQAFSSQGVFLFAFGEEGGKDGQFRYPWDVSINENCQIIVSDTKNHRIQLFSQEGVFIRKYGFETSPQMWKQFDSPRGVCFTNGGRIILTDFNNHRLAIIDSELKKAQFLGSEGSGPQQFFRPQGVAVDKDGRIAVADSRNYRVQLFEPTGKFLWQFGVEGSSAGEFNKPQGICFTRDSHIVVVDFGNNRIQIF